MDDGRRDFRGVEDLVHSVLMDVVDRAERSAPTLPGVPRGSTISITRPEVCAPAG